MWRPNGWNNPYSDDKVADFDLSRFVAIMKDGSCIDESLRKSLRDRHEAGADAMLEALKKEGEYWVDRYNDPLLKVRKGWKVIIPDE